MRFALDHHYSPRIAETLRERGVEAVTAFERDWHTISDEELLARCAGESFVLVTNNVADFMVVIRDWSLQQRTNAGVVFTSDAAFPRTRSGTGRFVTALAGVTKQYPLGLVDRVHWLTATNDSQG